MNITLVGLEVDIYHFALHYHDFAILTKNMKDYLPFVLIFVNQIVFKNGQIFIKTRQKRQYLRRIAEYSCTNTDQVMFLQSFQTPFCSRVTLFYQTIFLHFYKETSIEYKTNGKMGLIAKNHQKDLRNRVRSPYFFAVILFSNILQKRKSYEEPELCFKFIFCI